MFPRPAFFKGTALNFAENLLYPHHGISEDSPAVIAATEGSRETVSWRDLRDRVEACAAAMKALGIKEEDRVAGYLANHTNTLVAMLAAASLGAIWSGVSPDSGAHATLERLRQIEPAILFADNAVTYNGKIHNVQYKVREVVGELPGLKAAVVFDTVSTVEADLSQLKLASGKAWTYKEFIKLSEGRKGMEFAQLPPDHPVYILYSSGTTGSRSRPSPTVFAGLIRCRAQMHCARRHWDFDPA